MNDVTLRILDQSLEYALWGFLICFTATLFFISLQLQKRRKGLAKYYQEEFEEPYKKELIGGIAPERLVNYIPLSNRLRMAIRALWVASVFAVVCFVLVSFTPTSIIENFTDLGNYELAQLRLTSLSHNRFYEGFSLQGEVWNQSPETISGIRAVIIVWDSNQKLLDTISVPIDGDPLSVKSSGTFTAEYTKFSPFLYGYQVTFESSDGNKISHVEGFDVN